MQKRAENIKPARYMIFFSFCFSVLSFITASIKRTIENILLKVEAYDKTERIFC